MRYIITTFIPSFNDEMFVSKFKIMTIDNDIDLDQILHDYLIFSPRIEIIVAMDINRDLNMESNSDIDNFIFSSYDNPNKLADNLYAYFLNYPGFVRGVVRSELLCDPIYF